MRKGARVFRTQTRPVLLNPCNVRLGLKTAGKALQTAGIHRGDGGLIERRRCSQPLTK